MPVVVGFRKRVVNFQSGSERGKCEQNPDQSSGKDGSDGTEAAHIQFLAAHAAVNITQPSNAVNEWGLAPALRGDSPWQDSPRRCLSPFVGSKKAPELHNRLFLSDNARSYFPSFVRRGWGGRASLNLYPTTLPLQRGGKILL